MSDAAAAGPGGPRATLSLLRDGAHLAVLCAFAIAQPLFSLLGDNAEFFATRDAPALDIVVFALVVSVAPPLALLAVELLAGLIDRRARRGLHLVFVGLLLGLLAIQALKRATSAPTVPLLLATTAVAVAATAAYAKAQPVRSFLTVLSPAPLLFLVAFLCFSPVSKLVLPASTPALASTSGRSEAPVVMLVLDEFPVTDLLRPDGTIDAVRYPNFARLARSSTWYRNATTVYDSTTTAVPALLTGTTPRKGKLPTFRDHPGNLFTLFGGRGRANVSEEATSLCPERICPEERGGGFASRMRALGSDVGLVYLHKIVPPAVERELPSISETWGGFGETAEADPAADAGHADAPTAADSGRPSIRYYLNRDRGGRLGRWIEQVRASRTPSLDVKHALLPHVPFQYLPSGDIYRTSAKEPIPGMGSEPSWNEPLLVDQAYQRHLLQVGYVDRALGRLIDRLQRTGMWERALVAVTADHGVAFRRGEDRRRVTSANIAEIAPIPVFIKAPGQRRGTTSDVWLRSVDVLPTIAALLRVRLPWRHDGRPATSATVRERTTVSMIKRGFTGTVTIDTASFSARVKARVARQHELFGSGADAPGRYGLGPNRALIGRTLAQLAPDPAGGPTLTATVDNADALAAVDRSSGFVPVHVTGTIAGDAAGARHDLAFAVNGVIAGVSRSVYLNGDATQYFSVLVPPTSLRDGANDVRVLAVERRDGRLRLTDLGGSRR